MEGRGNAELDALGPDRVVVGLAVEPEVVDPRRQSRNVGRPARRRRNRALGPPRHAHDLEPLLANRVVEVRDGFFGAAHRNRADRGQAVRVGSAQLGHETVVGPARGVSHLVVVHHCDEQALARVEYAVVDAEVVHPLAVESGQAGGGPVQCVLGGHAPEVVARDPAFPALLVAVAPGLEVLLDGGRGGVLSGY